MQADVRHNLSHGVTFQANYTFSKVLSDANGDQQTDFEPFLDINNTKIERPTAGERFRPHARLKGNFLYDLPFMSGRKFRTSNKILGKIMEGWNVAGIFTKQSGSPFGILSGRGTLNRAGRSGQNTVNTFLKKGELDNLFQVVMTGTGPVFVPAGIRDGRPRGAARLRRAFHRPGVLSAGSGHPGHAAARLLPPVGLGTSI